MNDISNEKPVIDRIIDLLVEFFDGAPSEEHVDLVMSHIIPRVKEKIRVKFGYEVQGELNFSQDQDLKFPVVGVAGNNFNKQ